MKKNNGVEERGGLAEFLLNLFLLPYHILPVNPPFKLIFGTFLLLFIISVIGWFLPITSDYISIKDTLSSIFQGFTALLGISAAAIAFRWEYISSKKNNKYQYKIDKLREQATTPFILIGFTIFITLFGLVMKEEVVTNIFKIILLLAACALFSFGLLLYKIFGLGIQTKDEKMRMKGKFKPNLELVRFWDNVLSSIVGSTFVFAFTLVLIGFSDILPIIGVNNYMIAFTTLIGGVVAFVLVFMLRNYSIKGTPL
jgi:hypothetical protein